MGDEPICRECGSPVEALDVLGIRIVPPLCPACGDLAVQDDEREARTLELARARLAAGTTPRLLGQTLYSHPDPVAVSVGGKWLDAYEAGTAGNLWLHGPVGTGKTGLAWGIVRQLAEDAVEDHLAIPRPDRPLEPRHPALFVIWADLLDDLRAAMDSRHRAERNGEDADPAFLFERARRIPVLALDDLGRERPTPYALERLASLVEYRYQRQTPTIVTSNYQTRELIVRLCEKAEAVVGERIVSRLTEGATGHRFEGPSRRAAA